MVLALTDAGQRALGFAEAAAAALAVWLVLLAILAMASRPRLPAAGPAAQDLPGSESPAVVGFLTNRWEVGRETVPATLLDLAAKGAVSIDQVAPGRFVCRLKGKLPARLAPYEEQVLDHIRALASDGVVPCEALTTGPEEQSKGWWNRFQKAVVADARGQGLSRSRWGKPALVALGVGALAPALLAAAAFVLAPSNSSSSSSNASSSSSSNDDPIGAFLGLAAFGWGALMTIPFSLRAERDTPAGRAAAAKWLGLRRYLDEDEAFDQAPPASVAIWDRYLAYGAAMGVAAGAVRALPLGSESDREAWSAYGGSWHVVRVRYPVKIPPGWGKHPLAATAQGLATLAAAGVVAFAIGPPAAGALGDLLDRGRAGGWETWALVAIGVVAAIVLTAAVFALRAAVMLVLGVPDLFSRAHVEGLVIRLRSSYLAVDDGARSRVRAWRVEPAKLAGAARGSVVRVTVSPRLGHVFAVEAVGHRPDQAGLRAAPVSAAPDGSGPALAFGAPAALAAPGTAVFGGAAVSAAAPALDLAAVEARTGVHLQPAADTPMPAFPGVDRAFMLTDGGEGKVVVVVSGDHHGDGVPDVANRFLRWAAGRNSTPIDGVGDEASWGKGRVLTVRRGDTRVMVMVGLEDVAPDRRLDVAKALAEAVL